MKDDDSLDAFMMAIASLDGLRVKRVSLIERIWWKIRRSPREFRYWLKCQTKYRWQRGKRGWATNDTWSFDSHMAKVIAGGVRELMSRNIGHPSGLCSCIAALGEAHPNCDGNAKWLEILDEMATGFEIYESVYELDLGSDVAQAKLDRSLELFTKHFRDLWD